MKTFEILYGPIDTPSDEWEIVRTINYDPDNLRQPRSRYDDNHGPDYMQEHYVRRQNWDEAYSAKLQGREVTHRFMMRQVPEEQDYLKRATDNGWTIHRHFFGLHRHYSDHYLPRLSDDKVNITYYPTIKDARLDRPKTCKAVRFFRAVMDLGENDVEFYCSELGIEYGSEFILKFATTREEIANVYDHGPRSCMSGRKEYIDYHGFHPVECYAAENVAVAYLVDKDDPEHIASRALVNTANKGYVRIYGAENQMRSLLRKEGYVHSHGCMVGTKLLRIEGKTKGDFPFPYNDYEGHIQVSACGKFWEIV